MSQTDPSNSHTSTDPQWPTQYVRYGQANIRVIVQGQGPAILIIPSFARDAGADFDYFSDSLAQSGYKVLRPQPRGALGSTGPMENVTLTDLTGEIAAVIDELAGGRAILLGHAYGQFIAKRTAAAYPEMVPAVIAAAAGAMSNIPADIAGAPRVAANASLPTSERLAALQKAFFAPGHDASVWLEGWYPRLAAVQAAAIKESGGDGAGLCGGDDTQILDLIAAEDAFRPKATWNQTLDVCPERVQIKVVEDAGHALFPEQPQAVVQLVLPWLEQQRSRL